ncbi:MAG TPA: nucleotidyltransferase [Anaerolineales bacterium]|nr:nucleotidyltransferase [Anaerolineales bacterium]
MLPDPRALKHVIAFLHEHGISYMIIGGIANSIWGEPRATHDADFKVSIDVPLSEFRKTVLKHFPARLTNIPAHKLSPHVIHVWALPDVAADFLVSIFDYEKMAIDRAVEMEIERVKARICTAEDLIIHKMIASRGTDLQDVEGILARQRDKLDVEYIRNWLTQFSEALENPEILNKFNDLYKSINS